LSLAAVHDVSGEKERLSIPTTIVVAVVMVVIAVIVAVSVRVAVSTMVRATVHPHPICRVGVVAGLTDALAPTPAVGAKHPAFRDPSLDLDVFPIAARRSDDDCGRSVNYGRRGGINHGRRNRPISGTPNINADADTGVGPGGSGGQSGGRSEKGDCDAFHVFPWLEVVPETNHVPVLFNLFWPV
jgi:hypothetical protein